MTAKQQTDVANTQTGRAANVSVDATFDEEDHRQEQTRPDNSSSTPETVNNHQANAAEIVSARVSASSIRSPYSYECHSRSSRNTK